MKIYVDADGSPVVNIAVNIAKEYDLEIIIVKNFAHEIHDSYAEVVSVDISNDSADFYIVNKIEGGDIVVTQDYGLASLSLAKEAIPINQNGFVFTRDNIDGMLNRRHLHQQLRKQNKRHGNIKKRKSEADKSFEKSLRKLVESKLKV